MSVDIIAEQIANEIKLSQVLTVNKSYAAETSGHYVVDRTKVAKAYKSGFWLAPRAIEIDDTVVELLEERLDNLLYRQGVTR